MSINYPNTTSGGATLANNNFSGSQTITGSVIVSGSQSVTGSVTVSGSQFQFNNTSPSGAIFNAVTALTGASTKAASFQLNGNEVANISVDGAMVLNASASVGTSYVNPALRIPINGNTQLNLFQLGGTSSTSWEFALGFYTGATTPTISSRAAGLFFSSPANTAFSPLSPNQNDLGTSGNTWRTLYAASMITSLTASIRSGLGAASTDTCVQLGSSVADASVNGGARLVSLGTGIGGTFVEKFYVNAFGDIYMPVGGGFGRFFGAGGGNSYFQPLSTTARMGYFNSAIDVDTNGLGYTNASSVVVARFTQAGQLNQQGTDSTATPGAATINKPIGKSAIASGSSGVTITNNLVTTGSHILFSPHNRDSTCKELYVIPNSGSFTLTGSAAASATLAFSWRVSGLL